MRVPFVLIVGLLFLCLFASSAVSQMSDEKLIVPGQRVGKWTLDMTVNQLQELNGPADAIRALSGPDVIPIILYFWEQLGLVAASSDRSRVDYLYVTPLARGSEDFKTEKGIGKQASREEVIRAYGRPSMYNVLLLFPGAPFPLRARLIYDELGLAADLTIDRVSSLIVFRARTGKSYWKFCGLDC